ncbi:hypothetical protein [Georgenia yuyongxinii]|uniref:DUF308 domain-containing protein n=1 Tax=Georgenia yuyongxinii TaxID=2589797 RepID=A0A552WWS2_9MICO|nr:hypothetical protein [Georgenia yuyongxinii]TRW47165.1 hypothetical protein FJ693_02750 [Georgenia yuyongxinii]
MAGPTRDGEHDSSDSLDDATVAARWAELTASLGELEVPAVADPPRDPARGTSADGPSTEGPRPDGPGNTVGWTDDGTADAVGRVDAASGAGAGASGALPLPGPRDYVADEDDDEGYVPPEPEPLSHADPALTLGWVAAVGSVVVAIVLAILWRPLPTTVLTVLGLTMLAGVALLLWRMPDGSDPDDRSDGAVV